MKGAGEIDLEDLGYNAFFESGREEQGLDGYALARVTAEHKGAYGVRDTHGEYLATVTGRWMHEARAREDYPAVGDWVALTDTGGGRAVIHGVLPRKTVLERKYSGRQETQVIAANIDIAFVVEATGGGFSMNRAERYLALARDGGIRPVVVLNKVDLIAEAEVEAMVSRLRERFRGTDIIKTSAVLENGPGEMAALVSRGTTCCLLGPSGVGKSTLINRLLGEDAIRTDAVSARTGKGKHTTTVRQMYFLAGGGILIDNPGVREIGMTDAQAGIEGAFSEITMRGRDCRFADCTHVHEPGCAVREAITRGELDGDMYENYLKLSREAEYYEMTSLEKRRKDRDFGRFIKRAKKDLKKYE
ncbi:MAG: ribosome small subunit-dependent GTPase A [Actinomycetota bacterium]